MRTATNKSKRVGLAVPLACLPGCAGPQSVLDPQGPVARLLADTWWVLFFGSAAILLLVMALALYAVLRAPERRAQVNGTALIVAGGIAFPVITLTLLLLYEVHIGDRVRIADPNALRIEVIGHQWWWEVRYPDRPNAITANEIHIPAGRPVVIEVWSADVIHSFWVPRLAGKVDALPEQRNRLWLQADAAGVYRGQCSEFCGAQHARMSLLVVAQAPADFDAWLQRQQHPASAAQTPGRDAFLRMGCPECHVVRGLQAPPAQARGPDLTHIASRRTIAAATLENNRANLAAWVRDSQSIKPGNLMPSFSRQDQRLLDDVVAFLENLP